MKKLALFVQPRKVRQARFMEFYRRGFVLQWATDIAEARQVVSSIFDWVIIDLSLEPEAAQALCLELKSRLSTTKLAMIEAPGVKLGPDMHPDALVPRGIPTDAMLDYLTAEPTTLQPAITAPPVKTGQRAQIA
jgi:hypothetical protein